MSRNIISNVLLVNCFIFLLSVCQNPVLCIIGRDLVLTPRQGLQLTGKSIYYEEESNEVSKNATQHPWERTLKHVTFVTLFTDAAASAVGGNMSKLKEYKDFLASPYINKENVNPIRFGDIVMLANGRLERVGNHSFRFIEGNCGYDCEPERVWAIWQVQKIRHRDQNQNFRYEMKFSVSPLRTETKQNDDQKQDSSEEENRGSMYIRQNALKTYIQKEDDYPQNFGRIIYPEETAFAQRRQYDDNMSRNFRQVNRQTNNDYRQVTPIPQSTFLRGVFQPPPPGIPPSPERLNIGEYIKHFGHPQATPKIEVYPNVYNNLMTRTNFPHPTTYRPNYQVKLPRPEIYAPMHDFVKFPEDRRQIVLNEKKLNTPLVTHHFHHHFFMPGSGEKPSAEVNEENSDENQISSGELQKDIHQQVTPNFIGEFYATTTTTPKYEQDIPPAPQKIIFPINQFGEHIVEVTPPSPLRKPHGYTIYPQRHVAAQIPVIIYQVPVKEQQTTEKPFVQSEPMTDTFRYSEPDPLYANDEQNAPQVESPYHSRQQNSSPDSIEAQLPPPEKGQDQNIPYIDESSEKSNEDKADLLLNHSEKDLKISTPKTIETTTITLTSTETPQTTQTTDATTITDTTTLTPTTLASNSPSTHIPRYLTTPISTTLETATIKAFTPTNQFVSTSTTESPLRSISRTRIGRTSTTTTTTTTEPVVQKWKPKRRNQHSQLKFNSKHNSNEDNKAKSSNRHENVASPLKTASSNHFSYTTTTGTTTSTQGPPVQRDDEIFEVLTQKSVSKSVSIKVGNNGEEIPIIIDDDVVTNEVQKE